MVTWDTPSHVVWNTLAVGIWLLGVAAVVTIPTVRFRRGWRTKAWWLLAAAGAAIYAAGYYVPVGAVVTWLLAVQRFRRHPNVTR